MDRNYYKNGIPHETPITSWRWVGQKFSGNCWNICFQIWWIPGLAQKKQKWKSLTSICKNHYIWKLGVSSLWILTIFHFLVWVSTFILFLLWAMFKSLANISEFPYKLVLLCCTEKLKTWLWRNRDKLKWKILLVFDFTVERNVWLRSELFFLLSVLLFTVWFIEI